MTEVSLDTKDPLSFELGLGGPDVPRDVHLPPVRRFVSWGDSLLVSRLDFKVVSREEFPTGTTEVSTSSLNRGK